MRNSSENQETPWLDLLIDYTSSRMITEMIRDAITIQLVCNNAGSSARNYSLSSQKNLFNYSSRQRKHRGANTRISETDYKAAPKVKPTLCSYRDNCGIKLNLAEYFNRRNLGLGKKRNRNNLQSQKHSRVNSKRTERKIVIDNSDNIFDNKNRSSYSKKRASILAHPYFENTNKYFKRLGNIIDQTMINHHSNVNFERKVSFGSNQQGDEINFSSLFYDSKPIKSRKQNKMKFQTQGINCEVENNGEKHETLRKRIDTNKNNTTLINRNCLLKQRNLTNNYI